jgi:hypothetical protein
MAKATTSVPRHRLSFFMVPRTKALKNTRAGIPRQKLRSLQAQFLVAFASARPIFSWPGPAHYLTLLTTPRCCRAGTGALSARSPMGPFATMRLVTSPHRAPRKQQGQRDALDWEVPCRDPAEPRSNARDVAARRQAPRRRWRVRRRARAAQRARYGVTKGHKRRAKPEQSARRVGG